MQPAYRPTRRFTADEVLRMVDAGILAEDEPLELLDGELVVVTPQGPSHAGTTTVLHDRLRAAYGSAFVVREAKPMVAGIDSLPEPDLAVFRADARAFFERHPGGDEAVLIVEVAKTSLLVDLAKAETYARASVATYWLIDLVSRRLEVRTEPHADGRYGVVNVLAAGDVIALPASDEKWKVAELFPPETKRGPVRGRVRSPRKR
jgi:Uma2 family endonuclease